MKKILSIISTIIIIISSINLVSYADCNMNINYKKLIDFSEVINDDDLKSITQTIGDKTVTITKYDKIVKIKDFFNHKIKNNEKEINRIQNMKINLGALYCYLALVFKGLSSLTYLAGFAYNYYQISQENKVSRLIDVYKNIKRQVYEGIIKHKWIGNNVLITAVPTDSSCLEGYARFHNVDGVRYSKSQKAINWEFAKTECKFLNADHDDCYQEAKKTIDCLWDNLEDPSKCKNNPYYHPYSEDD